MKSRPKKPNEVQRVVFAVQDECALQWRENKIGLFLAALFITACILFSIDGFARFGDWFGSLSNRMHAIVITTAAIVVAEGAIFYLFWKGRMPPPS